jgi:hypothetical protein
MLDSCRKCRTVAIEIIPDKAVMHDIVERIALFEEVLKSGQPLTEEQRREKRVLEPVARELRKVAVK